MATATLTNMAQQLAAQYPTPATVPAIQRSQYLAQALQNLQDSTAQGIKSPGQLWSTLAATALLQHARTKADQELLGGYMGAQRTQENTANQAMGLPVAPVAPDPAASTAVPPSIIDRGMGMLSHFLGGGSPQTAPGAPPPLAGPDPVARIANAAPVGVQTPMLPQGGVSPIPSPGPGPGLPVQPAAAMPMGVPSPQAMQAMFPGVHVNSGYRTPEHNAEVGGVPNSWHTVGSVDEPGALDLSPPPGMTLEQFAASVHGQMPALKLLNEGDHLHLQPNARNTGLMPAAYTPPSSVAQPPAPQFGPTGPAPEPSPAMQPPQPALPPSPQPVPTGVAATPEEQALFRQYMSNPATRQLGLELAAKVAQRHAAPVDASKPYWGPDGQAHYAPGTDMDAHFDGSTGQTYFTPKSGTGAARTMAAPGGFKAPLTGNLQYGSDGKAQPIPGTATTTSGTPQPGSFVAYDASGKPNVVQAPPYDANALLAQRDKFKGSDTYKQAVGTAAAINSLQDMLSKATKNNGVLDIATFDALIRAASGLSARQGSMQMAMEHLGVPAQALGFMQNLTGDGFVTPEQLQNALGSLRSYATTHQSLAQHELDQESALAKHYGFDFGVTLPSINDQPSIPWMDGPTHGGGPDLSKPITAEQATALPKGTAFITMDGRHLVRK